MFSKKIKNGFKQVKDGVKLIGIANKYIKAELTFAKGNYEKAKPVFEEMARAGFSLAQHRLGTMYENGKGVDQDLAWAFYWYEQAAIQGDSASQLNCASMYAQGSGTAIDLQKSSEWIHAAVTNKETPNSTAVCCVYLQLFVAWADKAVKESSGDAEFLLERMRELLNTLDLEDPENHKEDSNEII